MKRVVLADSGPLYAAVDPDDAYHERARDELKRLARDRYRVVVVYPTLLEAYTLVLHRMGIRTATNWLHEILMGGRLVNPSSEDYTQAVGRIAALPDQTITLFDAVLATMAGRLDAEVWTYDHHFDVMRCKVWRAARR
jgi:predicted nucleic acid-binding protein